MEEVKDEVNREMILRKIQITNDELEDVIFMAKEWLLSKPKELKDSNNTLRTTRVMTFLKNHPKKTNNQNYEPKKRILS